ncbi:Tenascin-X [Trichostrongylus colubriformis]|uniref:Tenascin-X n=1 Tax=Trichostrongylus colubriformis TaxID=6319 RepID=A0AAN8FJR9_TRICO
MSFTSSTVYFISLLILISITVNALPEDGIDDIHRHHRHRIRSTFQRRKQPVCVHGKPVDGECECEQEYTGRHCEKQKHCASFRRYRNGSCPTCAPGYYGEFCEEIHCVHGEPSKLETKCECEEPYSGTFCDELSTKQVYSYYNRRVYYLGPLGALSLIPMCALYFGCEHMARKRMVKRIGEMLGGQHISVDQEVLQHFLNRKASIV